MKKLFCSTSGNHLKQKQQIAQVAARVARWFLFKPKIPIVVNFVRSRNGRCWHILYPFGQFSGQLAYFMAVWHILWPFGIFSPVLVHFFPFWYIVARKIWQPRVAALPLTTRKDNSHDNKGFPLMDSMESLHFGGPRRSRTTGTEPGTFSTRIRKTRTCFLWLQAVTEQVLGILITISPPYH
jgi:hypothetical protein